MCKFCDDLEYKNITIPGRTTSAEDNVCETASPDIVYIDGETYHCGSKCEDCFGCIEENSNFSITAWDDVLCLNYYHKVRDLIIAPSSCRFSINYCPMCGKRISKELHEELVFW